MHFPINHWLDLKLWLTFCGLHWVCESISAKLCHIRQCQQKQSVLQVLFSCFMQLPCMTAYIRFCSRQLSAAKFLQQLTEESPEFRNIMKQCQSHPHANGMPLSSFLIKPMQRITKYPLLIKKVSAYCLIEELMWWCEVPYRVWYVATIAAVGFCTVPGKQPQLSNTVPCMLHSHYLLP